MKNIYVAVVALASVAMFSQAAHATSVTTSGSFSCGTAANCTAGTNSVSFLSGTDSETISFTPAGPYTVVAPSNLSFGDLSMTVSGAAFDLSGLTFNLSVTNDGSGPSLVSTGAFSTPFGFANPEVTFSPLSAVVGNDSFAFFPGGGFAGNTGVFLFSANGAAQLGGTITPVPVPLPAALPLLLSGLAGLGFGRRRRTA